MKQINVTNQCGKIAVMLLLCTLAYFQGMGQSLSLDTFYIALDRSNACLSFMELPLRRSAQKAGLISPRFMYFTNYMKCGKKDLTDVWFSYEDIPQEYIDQGIGEKLLVEETDTSFLNHVNLLTIEWFEQTPFVQIQEMLDQRRKNKPVIFVVDRAFIQGSTIKLYQVWFFYSDDE